VRAPREGRAIQRITGLDYGEARLAARTGYASDCVCLSCLHQFELDLDRDARVCPKCAAAQVSTLRELVGQSCPKCKIGVFEESSPIQWKLDPDWETLPVPQIVKDLLQFEEDREVPASLQKAAEAASGIESNSLIYVALDLLGWWEGNYLTRKKEQKPSVEMNPQWTWCKALPAVLLVTPALAELVVIRDSRCWFTESTSDDVKRGIKNYIRKHRKHIVEA